MELGGVCWGMRWPWGGAGTFGSSWEICLGLGVVSVRLRSSGRRALLSTRDAAGRADRAIARG